MIVLSCFVFAIVIVTLGYCIWKYRAKPGDESDGEPIHGNTRLEIAWTVIPTIIVLFGAVYSAIVLADIEKKDPNRLAIDVIGPAVQVDLRVPDRRTARRSTPTSSTSRSTASSSFTSPSLDVLHSFWVPEWRIKRDLVPAGPSGNDVDNTVVVTPDRLGDLQRRLHRALRLRARDDAGLRPRLARQTSSTAGSRSRRRSRRAAAAHRSPTTTIGTDTQTPSTVTGTTTAPAHDQRPSGSG